MALELDEITQKILLEGDAEISGALNKIAKDGKEAFEAMEEAAKTGAGGLNIFADSILAIGGAIATAGVALVEFTEKQDSLFQKTAFLAEAFGSTVNELSGIETAFAKAGVSTQTFERFANRLTVSIAQQWPQIAAAIRTAATEQEAAQERIVAASTRVKAATMALADNASETSSRIAAANSRVEHAYQAVQFAAQHAAQEQRQAADSVAAAVLGVEGAQQRLHTLLGNPPSDSEKKSLEIAQARQAVTNAQAQADAARLAQQEKQAAALQKQRDIEQALSDARDKQFKEYEGAMLRRQQLENAVKEAATASAAADERAAKERVTNIASIKDQLEGIIKSGKDATKSVDLTQVSVVNLERAVFALSSAGSKEPTGIQALRTLSEILSKDTEELISKSQRLALVQKLSATSLANTGAAASELLQVLKGGAKAIDEFAHQTEHAFSHEALENVEKFKGSFETLSLTISLLKQNIAIAISPALATTLNAINDSITKSDGTLHVFIDGLKALGGIIGEAVRGWGALFEAIDKAFDREKGRTFQGVLLALIALVAAFATSWAAIPAAIALVVVAVGALVDAWPKIKKAAEEAWNAVKDSTVFKFFQGLIEIIGKVLEAMAKVAAAIGNGPDGKKSKSSFTGQGGDLGQLTTSTPDAEVPISRADGGEVAGPGTGTSDSILARLSNGEFVQRAAAVQFWGADFMHAINNMTFPGFATGGLVPSPVRLAGASGPGAASSTLNLTLGDRTFSGLRGSKSVVDDLASYAISRQTSAAGDNPSWMG